MYRILAFNFSKKLNKSGPTIQNIAHSSLALNLLVSVPDPGVQCHIKMESLEFGALTFFQLFDLLVCERRSIALKFSLQPQPDIYKNA